MNTAILNQELDLTSAEADEMDAIALVARIEDAKAKIAELTAFKDSLCDELAVLLDFGSHQVGQHRIAVTAPQRWTSETKAQFMQDYPESTFPYLYRTELDTKAADAVAHVDTTPYKHASKIQVTIR